MYHTNTNQSKHGQATLISDKVIFQRKKFTKIKDGHFIMLKRSIHQEYITILNIYTLKHKASKYINPKLMELQ